MLRPLVKAAATQREPEGSDDDFNVRIKSNTNSKAIILPASHHDGEVDATPDKTHKAHTCRQNSISVANG